MRLDVDNPTINFFLAHVLSSEKRFESARIAFERTIEISPDWLEAYLGLAQSLEAEGAAKSGGTDWQSRRLLDRYISTLEKALELSPSTRNLHNKLGNAYLELGMYASARIEYEREIRVDATNAVPHFNLGLVTEYGSSGLRYSSITNVRAAIEHYREALRHDPHYFPALFNLGTNLLIVGSYKEAAEVLATALKFSPLNDDVLTQQSHALWKDGKLNDALESLAKALRINPDNKYALRLQRALMSTEQSKIVLKD